MIARTPLARPPVSWDLAREHQPLGGPNPGSLFEFSAGDRETRDHTDAIIGSKLGVAETAYAMDVLAMQYKTLERELSQAKDSLARAEADLEKERDKNKPSGGLFGTFRSRPLAKPVR